LEEEACWSGQPQSEGQAVKRSTLPAKPSGFVIGLMLGHGSNNRWAGHHGNKREGDE
jgi:hypothetical protein